MTFETGKFLIAFVKLILEKVGADVFTGPRRESDVRKKKKFLSLTKVIRMKIEIIVAIYL